MPRIAIVTVPVNVVPPALPIRSQQEFFIVSPPSYVTAGSCEM